jgi:hypothetical protein
MPAISLPTTKHPMLKAGVTLDDVARALHAMREERADVERQTGLVIAECWLCLDAVFGSSVDDAYARLAEHVAAVHGEN